MEKNSMDTSRINGLRAIAALCIVAFSHYGYFPLTNGFPFEEYKVMHRLYNISPYLINLFFVISGFVMAYGYYDRIKNRQIKFTQYINRRIIRFYPMMIFSLFMLVILQVIYSQIARGWFAGDVINNNNLFTFAMNLLCLQSMPACANSFNAASWFLSAVFMMYVL